MLEAGDTLEAGARILHPCAGLLLRSYTMVIHTGVGRTVPRMQNEPTGHCAHGL